jgi:tetratricopeptide (TPR) repeat protein
LLLLLQLCLSSVYAQNDNLEAAKFHYEKRNYKKAKTLIDDALNSPNVADYADVWYYKGAIYEALLMEYRKKYGAIEENFFVETLKAYQKTVATKDFGNVYASNSNKRIMLLFTTCIHDGLNAYQRKEYNTALTFFEKALLVKPEDTTALNYAQAAAMANIDIEKVNFYTKKLLEKSYTNTFFYENYCQWLSIQNKATWVDFEIIRQIRSLFPSNKHFLSFETDFLLRFAKPEQALANIKDLLKAYPDYTPLWLNAGIISELNGDFMTAETSYKKVLELDSLNVEGHYSLGAYYYNLGIKKFQQARYDEAQELVLEDKHAIAQLFLLAIPYLEKAHLAQPTNQITQKALCVMYQFIQKETPLCKN